MQPKTLFLLPLWASLSPTSRKCLGLLAASVGLYHSYRLYRVVFPRHNALTPPSDYHNPVVLFIGRLVNRFHNFLDKNHISNSLHKRAWELSRSDQDLTLEVQHEKIKKSLPLYIAALKKCRSNNPRKHEIHADYAAAQYHCYRQDKTHDMIIGAVAQVKAADACWPLSGKKDDITYCGFKINFATIHLDHYLVFQDVADLGHALEAGEAALESCPPTAHGDRLLALLVRGRAGCAQIKSMKTPSPESVHLDQPVHHPNQAIQLLRDVSNLEYVLKASEAAVESSPPDSHMKRLLTLLTRRGRAVWAQVRSMETLSPAYLNQPISDLKLAIQLDVNDRDLMGCCQHNLAIALTLRYEATRIPEDISQAIVHGTEANGLLEGKSDQGPCLYNLAHAYALKYEAEMESYDDLSGNQYLDMAQETLRRAREIGDAVVKADCARLQQRIDSFSHRNTTDAQPASHDQSEFEPESLSPSSSMPMSPFEEPGDAGPSPVVGANAPYPPRMRTDRNP